MSNINYERLALLGNRVRDKQASKNERDEFMQMMYQNNNITEQQYNEYRSNHGSKADEIVNSALSIGVIVLLGYLLGEVFKTSKLA